MHTALRERKMVHACCGTILASQLFSFSAFMSQGYEEDRLVEG